jgi:NADPH:quinone reductase-like Zn-dependent oxidoreductase
MRCFRLKKLGDPLGLALCETTQPAPSSREIVVRVRAVSLNKRDLFILNGTYPARPKVGVIPLSDGAGEVVQIGSQVTRFKVGDRVAGNYFPRWKSGLIGPDVFDQLGCTLDGMLSEFAVLDEEWAVKVPTFLSWEEASTLPCAGVTAWNSVVGPQPLIAGQTLLTLGTGGVSLFALQFARMQGARVAITTSSREKEAALKRLGADIVINYAENPEWGQAIRDATGGVGAHLVVETMGADTIEQSMRAVSLHGQIVLLITRGKNKSNIEIPSSVYSTTMATIRRVFVGNRMSFESMNAAIEVGKIGPIIDRVFSFDETHEAYRYYMLGKAFGKVVISMPA